MKTTSSLHHSRVASLLDSLYADAAENDPRLFQLSRDTAPADQSDADFYRSMSGAYMAVSREFGKLLYALIRGLQARTVVEFGTSFGVSTIFLAAAVRDHGQGRVITTEFAPEKVKRAKENLAVAGLEEWVEFRTGDALETLRTDLPAAIDLVLLDGAKGLYLPVLQLLEPHLRPGAVVASDNTDMEDLKDFLQYLRAPENGYTSAAILTGDRGRGHEISVRN